MPGLSSSKVVELKRRGLADWGTLVVELHHEWLVLRPGEIGEISQTHPHLLDEQYIRARDFDVPDRVARLPIYGRHYLEDDSVFIIFRRRPAA